MPRSALVPAALGLLLALAPTSPAAARPDGDRASVVDKVGDAPKAIDITAARFAITKKRIRFRVDVSDLGRSGLFRLTISPINSVSDRIDVRRVAGKVRAQYYLVDHDTSPPTLYPRPCKSMTTSWRPGTDRLRVSLPAWCTSSTEGYGPYEFQATGLLGASSDRSPTKKLNY